MRPRTPLIGWKLNRVIAKGDRRPRTPLPAAGVVTLPVSWVGLLMAAAWLAAAAVMVVLIVRF